MFEYFNEGLVTKHDPQTENRNLFYAQYLALGGVDQGLNTFMHLKQLPNGLYLRSSHHLNRTVSHDEITGWMASSYMLGTKHRFEIWNTLKANYGAYPAVVKHWSDRLPFNPANYYAWSCYVGSPAKYAFFPFYLANMLIALTKPNENTSSKIIYWLELSTMPKSDLNSFLIFIYKRVMKFKYGKDWLRQILTIYHGEDKGFPIYKELEKLKELK